MATLTATFSLVDDISDKLESIASSGENIVNSFEHMTETADSALSGTASTASSISTTIASYSGAASDAAASTDHWTSAADNFSKSALESMYSTEELVENGFKTVDALDEQNEIFNLCDQSAQNLVTGLEASASAEDELNTAMQSASEVMEEVANNENISIETQNELTVANENAADAAQNLASAQIDAQQAMENYNAVLESGTSDLTELEMAAEGAGLAAERLAEANYSAAEATAQLSEASGKAADEVSSAAENAENAAENAEESGVDAVQNIASALAAAGITATIKEIAESVYELADAYSEAESIIVDATGATGDSLESLQSSLMGAFSGNYNDIETTASAIGEINTRMGLTGDTLTDVTSDFLNFANVTGSSVSTAVADVSKLINKYGLEISDVNTVLDQLTYAGQKSGASVSSLSSTLITGAAAFQNVGLSLENAISMLADFELAGINSSSAMMAMRTAVNKFSEDGVDAATGLQEVVNEIANMESATEATALAVDTFGSRAGQELALAIRNGTLSVDTFSSSLASAEGALDSTAEASLTLSNQWEIAGNKIKSAFTNVLEPSISGISEKLASATSALGGFLNEHETLTTVLSAAGVGLGVLAAGIAAVSAASLTAIPAVAALGAAISAAIWPLTAIAGIVTAVVGGALLLTNALQSSEDEFMSWTATTQEQYLELEELNAEYETACETQGEFSAEAQSLAAQIDAMTEAFESSKKSVSEFWQELHNCEEEISSTSEEFYSNLNTAKQENDGITNLTSRLQELASSTDLSTASQTEMYAIIDKLNSELPGLNLTYDDVISKTGEVVDVIRLAAEQDFKTEKLSAAWESYQEAVGNAVEATAIHDEAVENSTAALKLYNEAQEAYEQSVKNEDSIEVQTEFAAAAADAEDAWLNAVDAEEEAAQAMNEAEEAASGMQDAYRDASGVTVELAEANDELNDAATVQAEKLQNLVSAYQTAYAEIYEAVSSQFDIWDEAAASTDISMSSMSESLQSQLDYWNDYSANLQNLQSRNIDGLSEMVQSMNDGSAEAAGAISAMAGASDSELQSMVDQYQSVQTAWDGVSSTMADVQTGFSTGCEEIGATLDGLVNKMATDFDQSETAGTAATTTMTAYANGITNNQQPAIDAAQAVTQAVSAALTTSGADGGIPTVEVGYTPETSKVDAYIPDPKDADVVYSVDHTKVDIWEAPEKHGTVTYTVKTVGSVEQNAKGTTDSSNIFIAGEMGPELVARRTARYATGTTDSEDFFIAGENGPELIVGEQGSTVFPTSETDRLISALNERRKPLYINESVSYYDDESKQNDSEQSRHIYIEIGGSGKIEVGKNTDKRAVLDLLQRNIKPVLINLLQDEIFEEGERSYDF